MAHILIADDEAGIRAGLVAMCMASGHRTSEAGTGAETVRKAREEQPDLVLLDLRMPEGNGLEILPELTALEDSPSVVVLTGHADIQTAVNAMALGALDVLEKPIEPPRLRGVLERILGARTIRMERDRLREEVAALRSGPIVGRSPALHRVLEHIGRVAAAPKSTALITGESGVGKELVARAVHDQSARAGGPFIALNCAAIAEGLLEAELFGYEPGAFTGGNPRGHDGLIAAAKGGTIFLDELGELDLGMQAKLLRVLEERSFRRVGGTLPLSMDARIVASTNRDLSQMVEARTFREDLFYRLNVFSIFVPPLRARPDDIEPLAQHFLEQFSEELARPFTGFSQGATRALQDHAWPGNIRELRNAVERAAILTLGGEIPAAHVMLGPAGSMVSAVPSQGPQSGLNAPGLNGSGLNGPESKWTAELGHAEHSQGPAEMMGTLVEEDLAIDRMEKALIRRALTVTGGNKGRAARALGIHRSTLYKKLELYGIE